MYLAKSLGLNVKTLKNSYRYNTNVSYHAFPTGSNSPSQTHIPVNEAGYPNLEQVYWSIMDQYTNITEPKMREDKDKMWKSSPNVERVRNQQHQISTLYHGYFRILNLKRAKE